MLSIAFCHGIPEAFFGLTCPISAVQFKKYGTVRDGKRGFENQYAEEPCALVQLRNDLVVRDHLGFAIAD